eukprot:gnl/MRDRNA2_/MRDRNA2_68273_c0_seq1.p1 gnl/MRDRNA2_/MRDRNA2_68273_c0~~gnl/MRDRNA2_/MRDRNA2_68273_c0_seq1.p1  ORF type:complete len:469 (+),score=68.28 gnl/MRDRNA2_/MRDRNA2_68273_c0_seq1:125-1531(+)
MMQGHAVQWIIFLWTIQALCVSGLVLEGEFPRGSDFAPHIGKFCFRHDPSGGTAGIVHFELKAKASEIPKEAEQMELFFLMFDDEEQHWYHARKDWDTSTCSEKKASASYVLPVNVNSIKTTGQFEHKVEIHEKIRPRFWHFTLIACEIPSLNPAQLPTTEHGAWKEPLTRLPMEYTIHLQNVASSWQSEFSWEHTDLLEIYVGFCVAFICVWVYCHIKAKKKEIEQHPLVGMLSLSHALSVVFTMSFAIYYAIFSQHGWQCGQLRFLGVLAGTTMISLVFLAIMMVGEGWAEVKGFACSMKEKLQFFQAVFVLAGACAFCEIHDEFVVDQSTKLYSYQSVPGVLAMLIKFAMFSWFWRSTQKTIRSTQGQEDKAFYEIFLWSLTIWFLSVPVTVMMAWFISPWQRYKLITIIDLVSRLAGQGLLSFLLCGHLSPLCKLEIRTSSSKSDATGYELMDHSVGLVPAAGP